MKLKYVFWKGKMFFQKSSLNIFRGGAIFMKDEGKEWVEYLEKMKKINFFPYLITDPVKGDIEEIELKRDCSSGNHCGSC